MDQFAQIAANGMGGRMELLEERTPITIEKRICNLSEESGEPIKIKTKMNTKEELDAALKEMREEYKPFLRNLAPELSNERLRIDIKEFLYDGKSVVIPEYGGPMGKCRKTYTAEVEIPSFNDEKAVYIHFEGADYRTAVLFNGVFVGEHEGFFSPFEFEITDFVHSGKNTVTVDLYNDHIYMGNQKPGGGEFQGDKLYAATGLGWDDPEYGWHHCPPGMGIYNSVYIEIRNKVHISDIFVRPRGEKAEAWIEVENQSYSIKPIEFILSVYGQNFEETVFEEIRYVPETVRTVGMCDSLTAAAMGESLGRGVRMMLDHGKHLFKIPFEIKNVRQWDLKTPYLYQLQAKTVVEGKTTDCQSKQFGIRSFVQDTQNTPKGMFYLNERPIRLRGANTMGFEQQDVLRGDYKQLIDDILLAKLCNMNFLRLTQRPVQTEVYNYCDMLGIMTQTDLPLFACMRRFKVPEGIRQAEEMERLVRNHPCNIMVSYINEPMPNAENRPHRHLVREELEDFFSCCDKVVRMQNPDRVIKHVDGDYDPPTEGMPDNHCYPMWYNGHGIDIGRLNRGYWMPVKPGWYYGCGEYGAEGLECSEIMDEFYPEAWLKEPFNPRNIVRAQTADFHYFFYDTPETREEWIEKSQDHQAFATKIMTEAFRRDERMISHAIHLFIDAWPSGWMKTIMDCKRNPKKAYFAYRNALEPLMISLRTDKFTYVNGEDVSIEAFLCNDTQENLCGKVVFELYNGKGEKIQNGSISANVSSCTVSYVADAKFSVKGIVDRENYLLRAIMTDENGKALTYAEQEITVFEDCVIEKSDDVVLIEKLSEGEYEIAGEKVVVKKCGMLPLHFVSRKTNHCAVSEFREKDFSYWYNKNEDMITPIIDATFTAQGFTPILTSGNRGSNGEWEKTLAVAEKYFDGKKYVICQIDIRTENPVAKRFLKNIYQYRR